MFNFSGQSNKISNGFNQSLSDRNSDNGSGCKAPRGLRSDRKQQKERFAKMNYKKKIAAPSPVAVPITCFPKEALEAFGNENDTTLTELMGASNIPKTQLDFSRQVIKGILLSLECLHDCNISHGDLRLENIMLHDFNIDSANRVEAHHVRLRPSAFHLRSNSPCCSVWNNGPAGFCADPTYASPQFVKNKPTDALLADLWSVGCILMQLRFGSFPKGWETCFREMHQKSQKSALVKRFAKKVFTSRLNKCLKTLEDVEILSEDDFFLHHALCHCFLVVEPSCRGYVENALDHPWIASYLDGSAPLTYI